MITERYGPQTSLLRPPPELTSSALTPSERTALKERIVNQRMRQWSIAYCSKLQVSPPPCYILNDKHTNVVEHLAFSPDGKLLATASQNGIDTLWNLITGRCLATVNKRGFVVAAGYFAFSPDGKLLATTSLFHRTVQLWNVATEGDSFVTLRGHLGPAAEVGDLAFSPDGKLLAVASLDGTVKLWDVVTGGDPFATLRGHTAKVESLAFSPDGTLLATASWDNTVKLWDVATGSLCATLSGHAGGPHLAFSPDGKCLATASWNSIVRLWDVVTGAPLVTLHGHMGPVERLAFSPDGKLFATASTDQTVKLWDVVTGAPLATLDGDTEARSLAFSPDGTLL
ncbi:MAG: WD40 repeat domain-containing protein, partial [Verrucomicrobia bacterium]|nr:WD40 repeat domain-containing protein [Verrucomicrobiota bacterium]